MCKRIVQVDSLVWIYDAIRPKGFYFSGESHDFWEGVFVYKGKVTATADERVYQLEKGKFLLHKPMEFHRIWDMEESAARFVNVSFKISGEAAKLLENTCFDLNAEQIEQIWKVVNAFKEVAEFGLLDRQQEESTASGMEQTAWKARFAVTKAEVLLEAFLVELLELGEKSEHSGSEDEIKYARIVNVMKENCDRMLSVAEIAQLCALSASNMKRIFARFSDVGVAKYFMSLKMRRAKELLDAGMTVKEVAAFLHFEEINYFYTVFKRENGMTPTQYRRKSKAFIKVDKLS